METVYAIVMAMGIPSAIFGLLVWYLKKRIDAQEANSVEREKNVERLMMMLVQTSRANNVLAMATARAVQRIPDAQCNGDMTAALEEATKLQAAEKQFLFEQGIKHIVEE